MNKILFIRENQASVLNISNSSTLTLFFREKNYSFQEIITLFFPEIYWPSIESQQFHKKNWVAYGFTYPYWDEKRYKKLEKDKSEFFRFELGGSPNCPCCGAHDWGLYGNPCRHCDLDLSLMLADSYENISSHH